MSRGDVELVVKRAQSANVTQMQVVIHATIYPIDQVPKTHV
jgi:hypothetical protein